MLKSLIVAPAAIGLVVAPITANATQRATAPVADENGLSGQGTIFFLAGIAAIALAVVLLPEDQPSSP